MKSGFLITGRLKSTRLKQKLLLKIHEEEIIRWMIRRIKLSGQIDKIVLCTSTNTEDNPLIPISIDEGIDYYRGSEDDVIRRLYMAAQEFQFDYVLNITADCPLVSYEYIDKTIDYYKKTNADLIRSLDLPHGFFLYGISIESLRKINELKKTNNTEVWGNLFTSSGNFKIFDIPISDNLIRMNYRLTLDYPEDFEFFKRIYGHFGKNTYKQKIEDIIDFLDKNPEIVKINQHCKEWYQKRWQEQSKLNSK